MSVTGCRDKMSLRHKIIIFVFAITCTSLLVTIGIFTITTPVPQINNASSALVILDGRHSRYIIKYNGTSFGRYTRELDQFILPYESAENQSNVIDCFTMIRNASQVCLFRAKWLDDCERTNAWGYLGRKPCVLLTFEKNSRYEPRPYRSLDEISPDIPEPLKLTIVHAYKAKLQIVDLAWVYCTGATHYFPMPGIHPVQFSGKDLPEYLTPMVAVQFQLENDTLVSTCSLWDRRGKVFQVEILIQNNV